MSSLTPFSSSTGLTPREERRLASEIARTHARGSLMAAREVAKIDAITEITEEALFRASDVASITGLLVQRTPQAEAALNHIASAGIAAMADVVIRSGRSCKCPLRFKSLAGRWSASRSFGCSWWPACD